MTLSAPMLVSLPNVVAPFQGEEEVPQMGRPPEHMGPILFAEHFGELMQQLADGWRVFAARSCAHPSGADASEDLVRNLLEHHRLDEQDGKDVELLLPVVRRTTPAPAG